MRSQADPKKDAPSDSKREETKEDKLKKMASEARKAEQDSIGSICEDFAMTISRLCTSSKSSLLLGLFPDTHFRAFQSGSSVLGGGNACSRACPQVR